MIIRARNLLDQIAEPTFLANLHSAGSTTLGVKNTSSFFSSWAVQLGKTGEEQSEIKVLGPGAVTGTTLTTTVSTTFEHPADTPVYPIKYDQIIFKRSISGTAGTATAMSGGTVSITPDSLYTLFDDTSGATTYAYKYCLYNSVLATSSSDSDWITPAGLSFYSLAKMRQRIKDKLYDSGYIKSDSSIDDWINEWFEAMTNAAISVNEDYSLGTVDVTVGVGSPGSPGLGTITSSDFKQIRRIWITTDGVNYYQASKMASNDFYPNQTFNTTQPKYFMQGDNIIGVKPDDTAGTARIAYYKLQPVLFNDTDELPLSLRGYSKSFVHYGLAQAYYKDGKKAEGDTEVSLANRERENYVSEVAPRDKSGPEYMKMVDDLSGDDGGY